jgi:hypothetical protein
VVSILLLNFVLPALSTVSLLPEVCLGAADGASFKLLSEAFLDWLPDFASTA